PASRELAGFANFFGHCPDERELGPGDDEIDVMTHRSSRAHPTRTGNGSSPTHSSPATLSRPASGRSKSTASNGTRTLPASTSSTSSTGRSPTPPSTGSQSSCQRKRREMSHHDDPRHPERLQPGLPVRRLPGSRQAGPRKTARRSASTQRT